MFEGHGDDIYRYDGIKHNFSSNIFQGFDHSALCRWLGEQVTAVANYPSPTPDATESIIADYHGVSPHSVMMTSGATDAIYLLAELFKEQRSYIVSPTFSEYEDACRQYGHSLCFGSLSEFDCADLIWLCNPNNPTGDVITVKNLEELMSAPELLVVMDASYADYSAVPQCSPLIFANSPNGIMIKSLTKSFAVPGLRLGYIIANPEIISRAKQLRRPWAVGGLERKSVEWLFMNRERYRIDVAMLLSEASRVREALKDLEISAGESKTNFLLCRLPKGEACELKQWLVDNYGVLIRDASNFHGLTPRHFRIAVQRPEENDLLIEAIGKWLIS